MLRVLLSGCFLLAAGTSALAEEVRAASSFEPWIGHIAITVLGCLVAIHLAFESPSAKFGFMTRDLQRAASA